MKLWTLIFSSGILVLQLNIFVHSEENKEYVGNANDDFDNSLDFVKNMIKGHEPFMTPPMRDYIDYCNITGFYTMYRCGNLTAIKMNESISRLQLNLGWRRLIIVCRIHNKVLSVKVATANVVGVIDYLKIYTDAIVNYDDDSHTRIQKVQIVSPGKFTMQYKGEGFLGKTIQFFVGLLKPAITKYVHQMVVETVEILVHRTKHHLGFIGGGQD